MKIFMSFTLSFYHVTPKRQYIKLQCKLCSNNYITCGGSRATRRLLFLPYITVFSGSSSRSIAIQLVPIKQPRVTVVFGPTWHRTPKTLLSPIFGAWTTENNIIKSAISSGTSEKKTARMYLLFENFTHRIQFRKHCHDQLEGFRHFRSWNIFI